MIIFKDVSMEFFGAHKVKFWTYNLVAFVT